MVMGSRSGRVIPPLTLRMARASNPRGKMFANSDVTIGAAVSSWMCRVKEHPPVPPGQSKVELYAALRRDARDGMSNQALQCKYGVT